ncbi:MAG: acyl-CoA dehydrogenase C-terminal domain-containing protein [Burkholderiales bacterium]|nr:acyl-CoA dehydrogenase C-terminal domain-containing protein [Burkholderiales bacterium]
MAQYTAPLRDMQFVMHELLDVTSTYKDMPAHAETSRDTIDQVLEEAGKFCAEVLFPTNQVGDREGCKLDPATHEVKTPTGFKEAYAKFVEGGWPALSCDPQYGGQGLPHVVQTAFQDMMNSANQAWAMYPGLSHGAYNALHRHGTEAQKSLVLPKLVSGEWTGTMCLTEPHCGTDLGLLRSKAEPVGDGTYRITGGKIFISSGEHDLAANIVHLVLARLPDAPAGTRGISLFLVPKFLYNADGSLGARNAITCGAIEHKMGIHGNSTCQMNLDGAIGTLVGEPNKGLNAMFVMMNGARLGVGMQSLGLMEVAYQSSAAYARDRLQMRSLSGPKAPDKPADPIIVHPDVRRMLFTQRAYLEGSRAFAYWISLQADIAHYAEDEDERKEAEDMLALLTPIIKAFITDAGFECTNLGLQVFGGHGFISEWGMEQFVRDARINMIYEGTNGIQSLDLLGRKVLGDGGAKLKKFGQMIEQFAGEHAANPAMKEFLEPLEDIGGKVTDASMFVGMAGMKNPDEVGAASVDYLRLVGHMVYAYFWSRMAQVALPKAESDPFYKAKVATARFYFQRLLPEAEMLAKRIKAGSKGLLSLEAEAF